MGVLVLFRHVETTHTPELVTLGGFGYLLKDRVLALLALPEGEDGHRRVLAVFAHLRATQVQQ